MEYVAVILASLVVTVLGFAIEITTGDINHVRNGRKPNAGAAIFPGIPFIPIVVGFVAWLLNQWRPHAGTWTILSVCVAYILLWCLQMRQLKRELDSALSSLPDSANKPELRH